MAPLPPKGTFHGSLSLNQFTHLDDVRHQAVRVLVSVDSPHSPIQYSGHVFALDPSEQKDAPELIHPFVVSQTAQRQLAIHIPDVRKESFLLLPSSSSSGNGSCFGSPKSTLEEHGNEGLSVELCYDSDHFSLRVEKYGDEHFALHAAAFQAPGQAQGFSQDSTPTQSPLTFESPVSLTLQEAIHRALKTNLSVQQAEKVLDRAHQRAQMAYYELLPHFSAGGFMLRDGLLPFFPGSGNLIPFAFPNRWLKANSNFYLAQAENLAYTLVQLNVATAIQTLALTWGSQLEIRDEIASLRADVYSLLSVLKQKRAHFQTQVDTNSVLTIEILINDLDISLAEAENEMNQSQISLSNLLGFQNPLAVQKITLEKTVQQTDSVPILSDALLEQEERRLSEVAAYNSFELQQLHCLAQAAIANERSVYLNWFDSTTGSHLGLNLLPEARVAGSLVQTLELQIQETRQGLIAKTYSQLRDRNMNRKNYEIYAASLISRRERLDTFFFQYREWVDSIGANSNVPVSVSALNLRNAVKELVSGFRSFTSSKTAVAIKQVEVDRLTLGGAYFSILATQPV